MTDKNQKTAEQKPSEVRAGTTGEGKGDQKNQKNL